MSTVRTSRAAFGKNPHAGASRNNASARGWGPGWPNCSTSKIVTVAKAGVRIPVRREVAELVGVLLTITELVGYDVKAGQSWGFACRAIRNSRQASNHSWGLAVDINSTTNPFQAAFRTDLPPAAVKAWEDCNWYWGGRYERTADAMHFEYLGRPSDVAGDLKKAKAILAKLQAPAEPKPTTPPKPSKLPVFEPGSRLLGPDDRGTDVALLQRFLGVKPDSGTFNAATVTAVKRYQRMRNYEQDAVVGPITWGPILRDLGLTR